MNINNLEANNMKNKSSSEDFLKLKKDETKPKVSWLICTNVCNEYFRLSIESCLSQSYDDFEIILVINGDQRDLIYNNVVSWYKDNKKIRIFVTELKHVIFSLSLGLHYAKGDLIARMDSDDISKPNRLRSQVDFMNQFPEIDILGSDYEIINNKGEIINFVNVPKTDKDIRKKLIYKNPLCNPSVIFRKKTVTNIGGYLGSLHSEDYDLWMRLATKTNAKFASLNGYYLQYRDEGSEARGSLNAFTSQASTQFNLFLDGHGIIWLLASFLSCLKLIKYKFF
tara:strand:+ start:591 stop:1436 length:846 start_codon:yes stop_codon:yes gene_type:complete